MPVFIFFGCLDLERKSSSLDRHYLAELYTIYELPVKSVPTVFGKGILRIGYQYYDYKYTGSGN